MFELKSFLIRDVTSFLSSVTCVSMCLLFSSLILVEFKSSPIFPSQLVPVFLVNGSFLKAYHLESCFPLSQFGKECSIPICIQSLYIHQVAHPPLILSFTSSLKDHSQVTEGRESGRRHLCCLHHGMPDLVYVCQTASGFKSCINAVCRLSWFSHLIQ